jgi:2-(1,2-epoxy-1,2-dihydrophenyl)acetyl-CoA isomerase
MGLLLEKDGPIAYITLNRPEVLNAFNIQQATDFIGAVAKCNRDSDVRCIVVRGAGRAFCSGGDMKEQYANLRAGNDGGEHFRAVGDLVHQAFVAVRACLKPFVASIHGWAAGAGFGLALACDLRVAADDSQFMIGFPHTVGICADSTTTFLLPRYVGLGRTAELVYLSNEPISAETAQDYGIVNRVVSKAKLADATNGIALNLANASTFAIAKTKELLNETWGGIEAMQTQVDKETQGIIQTGSHADHRTALDAFFAKPRYVPAFKTAKWS